MISVFRSTLTRLSSYSRQFSSSRTTYLDADHSIYVSTSTNPYFNLTLEDWLFKNKDVSAPLLLLYRDDPCVVIGRNQNPWKEVNMPALKRAGIPFIRRRSGGGTVFHDTGNTNFSIHLPRNSFDRHATAQVVLRAVRSLDIGADVNDRNDVCVGPYKVSGSAYKIVKDRAYHHGTMLISTRLDTLGDVLYVNKDSMVTRGVASVRSPVRNLREFQPKITHDAFVNATVQAFREEYGVDEPVYEIHEDSESVSIPEIRHGMDELPSWNWAFGQTPEFTYTVQRKFEWGVVNAEIRSKHGVILSCTVSTDDDAKADVVADVGRQIEGARYAFVDDTEPSVGAEHARDVHRWLVQEMST
ncbi:Lipoyltransferase and lipoate-protein ligase [Auriscalpium vulgare]|uniref:Lipoyltransferase and lipoate-protein ligase n=1 Tax=Auriscalpium vulgare TaxID=40419 RepID=A0ACB8SBD2_9AGAM|nr:Lipoyltransferase and lipoate-protein ligase [Auriscalpium vulgare]